MKRLTTICTVLMLFCNHIMAGDVVTLYGEPEDKGIKSQNIHKGTDVSYDRDYVTISTDSTTTAQVTITGTNGEIMYNNSVTLSPVKQNIPVSDTPDTEKYIIEIKTETESIFGFFE